jgi:hypothetical protein
LNVTALSCGPRFRPIALYGRSTTVLSSDPDASRPPSGEKDRQRTDLVWCLSVWRTLPDFGSTSTIVQSLDPDASTLPSGEKARQVTLEV